MSQQDIVKAELKARRSSRELEQGLDRLGVKLGEGIDKANELKARAAVVADKVKHPRDTVSGMISARLQPLVDRGRGYYGLASGRYASLPGRTRRIALGALAGGVALAAFLVIRARRRQAAYGASALSAPAEAERYSRGRGMASVERGVA